MLARAAHVIQRESLLLWRAKSALALPWLFYIMVVSLIVFALGPDEPGLALLLPRLVMVALLLSLFMQSEHVFHREAQSGYLVQYLFDPLGFSACIMIKLIVMLLMTGLPLLMVCGSIALMVGVSSAVFEAMMIGLALALPTLFLLTVFCSVLTLSLPRAGLLNAVVLVPFYIPVLMFCEGLIMHAQWGDGYAAYLYLLAALLVISVACMPALIILSLRQTLRAL